MGKERVNGGGPRLKLNTQWLEEHESVLLSNFPIPLFPNEAQS